jgi:hypothetical protein
MKAQEFIKAELKRRTDLVECLEFRKLAVELAKKMGITAQEWNNNKAGILLLLANEFCAKENQLQRAN